MTRTTLARRDGWRRLPGRRSDPDQLEDMLRRLLAAIATPAPVPEVPAVEKILQRLVAETQSRPPPVVSPHEPVGLEKLFRSYLSKQQPVRPPTRQRPIRRDWSGDRASSHGKRRLIRGEWISSNVRPQDPGGGAPTLAALPDR